MTNSLGARRCRRQRTIAAILSQVACYAASHAGQFPRRKSGPDAALDGDSWSAICQALARGAVVDDLQWQYFVRRADRLGLKPSLASLVAVFRDELAGMPAAAAGPALPPPAAAALSRRGAARRSDTVSFAHLIEPLASICMGSVPQRQHEAAERFLHGNWNPFGAAPGRSRAK